MNSCSEQKLASLAVYFWLPAGKDAFGVAGWDTHYRINPLIGKKKGWENPIGINFLEKMRDGKGNIPNNIRNCYSYFSEIEPNLEFASRGLASKFSYFSRSIKNEIKGEFRLWSVGVYLWVLGVPEYCLSNQSTIMDIASEFFNTHILEMVHGGWGKGTVEDGRHNLYEKYEESYKGILNFNQIEMLFDTVFNYKMSPHSFFRQVLNSDGVKSDGRKDSVTIEDVIGRLIVVGGGDFAFPLMEAKKTYLNSDIDDKIDYQILISFFDQHMKLKMLINDPSEYVEQKKILSRNSAEYILSRLVNSAMEQFVRIAITHGGILYREGMSFIRTQLVEDIFNQKIDRKTRRVLRPSHKEISGNSTSTQIEVYFCMVEANFSALQYLYQMIKDISEVVKLRKDYEHLEKTKNENDVYGDHQISCFRHSRRMLEEALMQFERLNTVIDSDVQFVRDVLDREKNHSQISELSELRRIHELDWERRSSIETQDDDNRSNIISSKFTVIAGILAFITISFQMGGLLFDKMDSISYALLSAIKYVFSLEGENLISQMQGILRIMIFSLSIYIFLESMIVLSSVVRASDRASDGTSDLISVFRRRRFFRLLEQIGAWWSLVSDKFNNNSNENKEIKSRNFNVVLDCSSLHYRIGRPESSSEDVLKKNILQWQQELIDIISVSQDKLSCKEFHTSYDNVATNIQKLKYSFRSDRSSLSGLEGRIRYPLNIGQAATYEIQYEYTMHIECERHTSTNQIYLTDFRIFIGGVARGEGGIDFEATLRDSVDSYIRQITGYSDPMIIEEIIGRFGYRFIS
jgi:hypothetical protein